jgi:hypothetical protein
MQGCHRCGSSAQAQFDKGPRSIPCVRDAPDSAGGYPGSIINGADAEREACLTGGLEQTFDTTSLEPKHGIHQWLPATTILPR